jgi:hypothetical protein
MWIGAVAPGSFGLLYTWNDEGPASVSNRFEIRRLVRGILSIHEDTLLSPCIPTVEDSFEMIEEMDG